MLTVIFGAALLVTGFVAWNRNRELHNALDYIDAVESELDITVEKLHSINEEGRAWVLANWPSYEDEA